MNIKSDVHKLHMGKEITFMRYAQFPKSLTIALSQDVYDVLKEVSDADRISMAECVREILLDAVRPYLDSNDTAHNIHKEEDTDNE